MDLTSEEQRLLSLLRDPDTVQKNVQYDFDKNVQQDILSLMMHERSFMIQAIALIKSNYFVDKAHVLLCKVLVDWFEKHVKNITGQGEQWIQDKYIRDQLNEHLKDNPAKSYYLAEYQSIFDCYVQGLTSRSYCMERIVNFAKDQEIRLAIAETVTWLNKKVPEKYDKIKNFWDHAFLVGPQMDLGLNYFEEIEERYLRMIEDRKGKDRFSSGFDEIDIGIVGGGLSRGEIGGYEAMSGIGKCFEKNTLILMYDGSIKKVQDVKVGDVVMGDDSTPRNVMSTHTGKGMMYKVVPTKGDPYVVNGEHILCLKQTGNDGKYFNISVKEFITKPQDFQRKSLGYRTGVNFTEKKPMGINPYTLGVWLGDSLRLNDIVKYWLKYYGLFYNKYIPLEYKANLRDVRLELLAGLIDADGSIFNNNHCEFSSGNKQLVEEVAYLARSLGFSAYIKLGRNYWRVFISGDCSQIPSCSKPNNSRKQIENHLFTNIEVLPYQYDTYYGFTVDGNNMFLLGDFTVVHNSWCLCKAAIQNVRLGHKVLLVTLEMNQDKTAERFDTLFTGVNMEDLLKEEKFVKKKIETELKTALVNLERLIGNDKRRLMIKHFAAGAADLNTIRAYYSQLSLHEFKPDIVLVDYIGEFKDFPGMKTYESRQRLMRDLRSFGVEENHCTLTALQANRAGAFAQEGGFITDSEIGDSYGQIRAMDACWSINQTRKEKLANVGRIFIVKTRNGRSRYHFCYHQDPVTLNFKAISDEDWKERCSAVKELKNNESPMESLGLPDASKFIPNGNAESEN